MSDSRVQKFAKVLVEHSTRIVPGDRVLIAGSASGRGHRHAPTRRPEAGGGPGHRRRRGRRVLEPGPCAELNEGVIGESYAELVPEWFAEDYFNYYPTTEQLTTNYKSVDWDYFTEHLGEWSDQYSQGRGQ